MPQDVALIKSLGVDTYRFSVAWPRVQPGGRGPANPAGLAFYDRLVDELLANGIDPWVTLYHWDLPQELEDAGGWPDRDTAYRFADYAMLVFDQLGDRVEHVDHAERAVVLGVARLRRRACTRPGRQGLRRRHRRGAPPAARPRPGDPADAGRGDAARHKFGITLNMGTADPATDTEADRDAARRADGMGLRIYLDPLRTAATRRTWSRTWPRAASAFPVQDGDLEVISAPFDVLGVNFYFGQDFSGTDEQGNTHDADGHPVVRADPAGRRPRTAMDWPITPERLHRAAGPAAPRLPGPAAGDHRERRGVRRQRRRRRLRRATTTGPRTWPSTSRRSPPPAQQGADVRGLLRLVADGQLRVGRRLREALRHRARGLRHPGAYAEAERALVPRHDPRTRGT